VCWVLGYTEVLLKIEEKARLEGIGAKNVLDVVLVGDVDDIDSEKEFVGVDVGVSVPAAEAVIINGWGSQIS
jgi:hypothetical protein